MYSIGEISKIVNISADALRYYDEIDLLKPHYIEQDSRYRYYSEEQINNILFIMEMKQYGFSLETIKELLNCQDDDNLSVVFESRLQQLNTEMENIQKTIITLKRRISEIKKKDGDNMASKTVLIVDDSAFMRMILKDILEKHNYRWVGEAVNGQEGFEKFMELKPDVVILDIRMTEEKDGINTLRKIKSLDSSSRIIILSAVSLLPNVLECIHAGANDFIAKPFQAEYLLDVIEKVTDSSCNYNFNTVESLLADTDFITKCPQNSASQANINELLALISEKSNYQDTRVQEFIKRAISNPELPVES